MSLLDSVLGAVRSAATGAGPDVVPGTLASWAASFRNEATGAHLLTVGSQTYDGSVSATLPWDVSGGTYEIVIEGMTDQDYHRIRLPSGTRLAASIHLWWHDSPAGILADLGRATGLAGPFGPVEPQPPAFSKVADIRVDTLRRRAGERRYEAVVTGRERAFAALAETRMPGRAHETLAACADRIATAAGVTIIAHGLGSSAPPEGGRQATATRPQTCLAALTALARQTRDAVGLYGLPLTVIRDDAVHLGRWTQDADGARAVGAHRRLDPASGLARVDRGNDPDRAAAAGPAPAGALAARASITATCLGRPDILPGDVVAVPLPPQDYPSVQPPGTLAALAAPVTDLFGSDPEATTTQCRVTVVSHRVSRRQGFVTTVQAIVLGDNDDGWDPPPPGTPEAVDQDTAARPRGVVPADPAQGAADAMKHLAEAVSARGRQGRTAVGQVRATGAEGPRGTSDFWYATAAAGGQPMAVQNVLPTADQHGEILQVPYLTPFAWGNFGLVLPRYPGTRTLLMDAGGGPADVVDVGAVWFRDAGPPASIGDYWLVLPVGVDPHALTDDDNGAAQDGEASHDLIDAQGTRVIETTRFVVRVTDSPTACTGRPEPGPNAPDGTVLIENKQGDSRASIVLKDDGTITITANAITFDTSAHGDITLKAQSVKVQVSGTMDVS